MEDSSSIWQVGFIALLAGGLIGALAYRFFSPSVKQADKIKSELDSVQDEFSQYKSSVDQHFDKTSELVNNLTQDYVKVYQHLAEGAQHLGSGKSLSNLQRQNPERLAIAAEPEAAPNKAETQAEIVEASPPETSIDEHAAPFAAKPADASVSEASAVTEDNKVAAADVDDSVTSEKSSEATSVSDAPLADTEADKAAATDVGDSAATEESSEAASVSEASLTDDEEEIKAGDKSPSATIH